jgi:hypothetical protein
VSIAEKWHFVPQKGLTYGYRHHGDDGSITNESSITNEQQEEEAAACKRAAGGQPLKAKAEDGKARPARLNR